MIIGFSYTPIQKKRTLTLEYKEELSVTLPKQRSFFKLPSATLCTYYFLFGLFSWQRQTKKHQFQLCFCLCNIHFYTIISLRYSSWKRAASFKIISQSIFTVLTALRKLSRERSLSMFITSTKVGDTLVLITIHGIFMDLEKNSISEPLKLLYWLSWSRFIQSLLC